MKSSLFFSAQIGVLDIFLNDISKTISSNFTTPRHTIHRISILSSTYRSADCSGQWPCLRSSLLTLRVYESWPSWGDTSWQKNVMTGLSCLESDSRTLTVLCNALHVSRLGNLGVWFQGLKSRNCEGLAITICLLCANCIACKVPYTHHLVYC